MAFGILVLIGPACVSLIESLEPLRKRQSFQTLCVEAIKTNQYTSNDDSAMFGTSPIMVSVAHIGKEQCIIRFASSSIQIAYDFLHTTLTPLRKYGCALQPYKGRICDIDLMNDFL